MYQTTQSEMTAHQMAINLQLDLIQFRAKEWIGRNGYGSWVELEKFYWIRHQLFHSGPFVSSEQALAFIRNYYYGHPEERTGEQGASTPSRQ